MVLLETDPFLTELTKMYERTRDKGSVWVTLKRSSMQKNKKRKLQDGGGAEQQAVDYRCLVRATDGKKTISTTLSAKDHQRFQAAYATVLKAHMDALKKRERKDRKDKKTAENDEKNAQGGKKAAQSKKPAPKPST
uniref:Signal recognition particle 14 kDa protein n=1 Tax=Araucaria cunninghamii TaxID=56994 RepID=A0A0D6QR18_ARACU